MAESSERIITVKDSDEEEEEEDVDIPPRSVCEERCQSFAEITGTDTALAMFYLQDRKWILEEALNDYFQSQSGNNAVQLLRDDTNNESKDTISSSSSSTATTLLSDTKASNSAQSPITSSLRREEKAEIIFLQEVVERSFSILKKNLPNYESYCGLNDQTVIPLGAYFTVMLIRKDCSVLETVKVSPFPHSQMERTLLEVQCQIKGVPMTLLTSHLESTAEFSGERKRQLKIAFDRMRAQPCERTVIFGGDLNLRDKELKGDSSKPTHVYDLWECTGKRPEARFTWDLTINDNKQMGLKFQPRCRFDRLYIRHPEKSVSLKPVYFELTGIQRLSSCHRFASDHWAILAHLDMKK